MEQTEETDQSGVQNFVNVIEKCEKTKEIIDWLSSVCQPEDQLINSFIQTFYDYMDKDIQFSNQIIRSLQKLNEFIPQLILPQLKKSTQFPSTIAKYITQTETKNLAGECYLLLADIFTTSQFSSLIDEQFITALLTALSLIENEEVFKSIIAIILSISYEYKTPKDNLVITAIQKHQNERYFLEYLMHFINKGLHQLYLFICLLIGTEIQIQQCLKILNDCNELKIHNFLYQNDQKMLIDILLQQLDGKPDQTLAVDFIKCLGNIIKSPDYQAQRYRFDEIMEMFAQLTESTNQAIKKQIVKIINSQ